jgi:hypothetical protein
MGHLTAKKPQKSAMAYPKWGNRSYWPTKGRWPQAASPTSARPVLVGTWGVDTRELAEIRIEAEIKTGVLLREGEMAKGGRRKTSTETVLVLSRWRNAVLAGMNPLAGSVWLISIGQSYKAISPGHEKT